MTRRSGAGGPPGWLAVGGLALLTAVTAAFGGLAPAEPRAVAMSAGEAYTSDMLTVTIESATVADAVESQYLEPDPGSRVLIVAMEITNHADRTIGATNTTPGLTSMLFDDRDSVIAPDVTVEDELPTAWYADGIGRSPSFQPGLPTRVEVAWVVPADAVVDGDDLRIDVHDFAIVTGQVIVSEHSRRFRVGGVAASITVPVIDAGATP